MCPNNILSAESRNKLQSVLIIEKDENLRKGIAVALMSYFSEIIMVENFDEAFTYMQSKNISVVIAGLSRLSGQFSNELKSIAEKYLSTKFLITIPDVTESFEGKFEKYANVSFFEKPIDINSIVKRIIENREL